MAKKQVSLYIDDAAIHVMVCRGRHPEKWYSSPLQPGIVSEGVIKDQEAVVAALKEVWHSQKIGSRKVAVAVSGVNCLYQMVVLPELPDDLLAEAVSREASQSLGIAVDEVYLSWQVLSVEHGQMRLYLTAMPRETVDAMVAALSNAGLKVYLMDLKPLCLARAASEARAVIVDTQPGSFDIVVLGEGIPEIVRSLSLPEDAPVGERYALLKGEMDRAIAFYNSAHMDKPIDLNVPIMVSGDIAYQESDWDNLRGPRERIVQAMMSPVDDPQGFSPARYVTNIGMALKEILSEEEGAVTYSVVNFNALPEAYQLRRRPLSETMWLPTVAVGLALVIVGFWAGYYLSGDNSRLSDELEAVQARTAQQEVRASDIEALRNQVTPLQGLATSLDGMLGGLESTRSMMAGDLAEIYGAVPPGVNLENVMLSGDGASLNGRASSGQNEVFLYAWNLKEGGRFSSVIVSNISVGDGGEVSFRMILSK